MTQPKKHESRKIYQREWQREKQRKALQGQRTTKFKQLLDVVLEYEQQGMTYQEIAEELAKDFRYGLIIRKEK